MIQILIKGDDIKGGKKPNAHYFQLQLAQESVGLYCTGVKHCWHVYKI